MRSSLRAKLQLDKAGTFTSKKELSSSQLVKQQDIIIEKNYSQMDTEELNEYFEQLGDILGSDATESE